MVKIDGRKISIGRPGKVTHKLLEMFRELRTRDGVKVVYETQPTEVR